MSKSGITELSQDDLLEYQDEDLQQNKYLLFNMGDEIFGIAIGTVTEIVEMQTITQVPDMPDYIRGVINLRGRVVPLMDLRLRFGIDERVYDDRTCVIIVTIEGKTVGVIVDTVAEVHDIVEENIDQTPSFGDEDKGSCYVSGLAKVEDRVVILIDACKLIEASDLETVSQAV